MFWFDVIVHELTSDSCEAQCSRVKVLPQHLRFQQDLRAILAPRVSGDGPSWILYCDQLMVLVLVANGAPTYARTDHPLASLWLLHMAEAYPIIGPLVWTSIYLLYVVHPMPFCILTQLIASPVLFFLFCFHHGHPHHPFPPSADQP